MKLYELCVLRFVVIVFLIIVFLIFVENGKRKAGEAKA